MKMTSYFKKSRKKNSGQKLVQNLFDGGSTKDLRVEGVPAVSFVINQTEEKI